MEKLTAPKLKKFESNFFLITGDEDLLRFDIIKEIRKYYRKQGITEYLEYNSDDSQKPELKIDWNDFNYNAFQSGLFSKGKIIHIFFNRSPNTEAEKQLLKLVEMTSTTTYVIISLARYNREKDDKTAWFNALNAPNKCLRGFAQKININKYPNTINEKAKKLGITIEVFAVNLLIMLYENNLLELVHLLEQFALRGINLITEQHVIEAAQGKTNFTAFQFIDELLSGKSETRVMMLLDSLIAAESNEPLGLISLIRNELNVVYQLANPPIHTNQEHRKSYLHAPLYGNGANLEAKFLELKVWKSKQEVYIAALSRLNRKQVYEALINLADIEIALKTVMPNKGFEYIKDFVLAFRHHELPIKPWLVDLELGQLI